MCICETLPFVCVYDVDVIVHAFNIIIYYKLENCCIIIALQVFA